MRFPLKMALDKNAHRYCSSARKKLLEKYGDNPKVTHKKLRRIIKGYGTNRLSRVIASGHKYLEYDDLMRKSLEIRGVADSTFKSLDVRLRYVRREFAKYLMRRIRG